MQEHDAIARMKRGDISGLDSLVRRYQVQALRTAMLITRDKALAEDVVQNAFIRAYQKIDQYDASRPFAPWFMRSVANAAVQATKKNSRTLSLNTEVSDGVTFEDLLPDTDDNPGDRLEAKERQQLVKDALDKLTPEQRAAVVMRYFLGMSEHDMSQALDTPRGTIKWRLHQSRKRLRGLIQRMTTTANEWGRLNMKKQIIQQEIQNILTEEIPDDMNILPELHKQLQNQPASRWHMTITLSRVAAVIAIFLLVSAGGYALFQRNLISKDIPQQSITDINETQTIQDVAVTLNWAYADAHRLALAYSMEYEQRDDFINAPVVTLTTAEGVVIPQAFGGGGGGGGAPNKPIYSEMLLNFDTSIIDGSPETIDLILTLDFSADAILSNPDMAHMTGGGGMMPDGSSDSATPAGGGGGGGSLPIPTPDVTNIVNRVYTFNFTLPFYQALEVEPTVDTVESNGVIMTVNNIRYTPSLTKFNMCYNMPDDDMWGAQIQIVTNSPDSPFYSRDVRPVEIEDDRDRPCFEANATAAILDDAEELVINVLYLSQHMGRLTQEAARAEEAYFAELGYIIEIDADTHGYTYDILDFPEDITEVEAEGYIMANLFYKRYEGDWTFTVPLR